MFQDRSLFLHDHDSPMLDIESKLDSKALARGIYSYDRTSDLLLRMPKFWCSRSSLLSESHQDIFVLHWIIPRLGSTYSCFHRDISIHLAIPSWKHSKIMGYIVDQLAGSQTGDSNDQGIDWSSTNVCQSADITYKGDLLLPPSLADRPCRVQSISCFCFFKNIKTSDHGNLKKTFTSELLPSQLITYDATLSQATVSQTFEFSLN
ncbi:hypothetical protein ABKN59_007747 [Abortiporus biennis]